MSSLLWKAYYEDDVDTFRHVLEATAANARPYARSGLGAVIGSPGAAALASSPTLSSKARKVSGPGIGTSTPTATNHTGVALTRADINWRDATGLTILHHAASSTSANAATFASALIEHPLIDLYAQDHENGWTALHRAFYFGNVSIARLMLEREAGDVLGTRSGHAHPTMGLIKVKDREGHGPLDLYAATIKDRTLRPDVPRRPRAGSNASDELDGIREDSANDFKQVTGDEMYTFGSNKNITLGFGDEDDRHFPERITLRRPEHLLRRFYREHLEEQGETWAAHDPAYEGPDSASSIPVGDIPWTVRTRPLVVRDVHMAKLQTAVLTADPESNLYTCGHGQGGRLGTGDERTRFTFVCIEGGALAGKRIATVALGQNHTLALSDDGEIFSWGNNGYGQLGYSLPKSAAKDEDPISTLPRQIFGPLKRETVTGIATSRIHSVAFTSTSLYTFGKNDGQLGIIDSDARSLEVQITPRKVAASLFTSPVSSVSAIDRATVCLLENHDIWVFANYGYARISFPLEGFTNYFLSQCFHVTRYDPTPNRIVKITSGGDTVCALSSRGEIFTLSIARHDNQAAASTTNPAKIRSAIAQPQCIWSLKKGNMAARDVGVDADGSIVLATEEGSVWKRTKRDNKDAAVAAKGGYRPKDYKFSRIPGLTRALAVRASAHGAYAAVRRDCDVTKTQIVVEDPTLWKDVASWSPLRPLGQAVQIDEDNDFQPRFWQPSQRRDELQVLKRAIIDSKDIENDLKDMCERGLADGASKYDAVIATGTSEIQIPVHRFLLTGRSKVLRRGFRDLCETSTFTIPDLAVSELDQRGRAVIRFHGLDILTIVDLVLYLYTDGVVDFWHLRNAKDKAYRYRQIRTELMKVAAKLELVKLEVAVRQMIEPKACLDGDLAMAFQDPAFFYDGDVVVRLEDGEVRVHSALVCGRCPFFSGLFVGRAGGRWVAGRGEEEEEEVTVDLSHISSKTFGLVLRHIYADAGPELFDGIVSADLDEFLDVIMDVLSAANELMLDRLSQVCQSVIGRYVNARNVCWLLNAVSPSSVHEFKHAALEYLCLNLEAMLQGHHLNELEEDLLQELDEVVRQNQLNCMPFAKSGRAELELHDRHPGLAAAIDRNRRAKIDAVRLRSKFQNLQAFSPGSLDDDGDSPMQQKGRRRSSIAVRAEPDQPALKTKASSKDMMFAMDEEMDGDVGSPSRSPAIRPMSTPKLEAIPSSPPAEEQWFDSRGKLLTSPRIAPQQPTSDANTSQTPRSPMLGGKTPPSSGKPWTPTPLQADRTDLRNILAQASSSRTSSLSQGLAGSRSASIPSPSAFSLPAPKMSQKDRKKLQHQQSESPELPSMQTPPPNKDSPWQTVSATKIASLKDVMDTQKIHPAKDPLPGRGPATPQLTMRQTVAHARSDLPREKPSIGPGRQAPQQQRGTPDSKAPPPGSSPEQSRSQPKPQAPAPTQAQAQASAGQAIPHSVQHRARVPEPALQLSMSDIVAQQQAEKDVIREAAARRDLQDIQAEQEFQEWWRKESARVQEAERRSGAPPPPSSSSKAPRRGRPARGGKPGRGGEKGKAEAGRTAG